MTFPGRGRENIDIVVEMVERPVKKEEREGAL